MLTDLAAGVPLRRPPLHDGVVARPRLRDTLTPDPSRPVTLVSAPAGYGKSTAVAQWLKDDPRDTAWLSLGSWDRTPAGFLAHLAGEIRELRPDAMQRTLALLDADGPPEPSVIGFSLLMDMAAISPELVVVLDGTDHLADTAALEAVAPLLRNPSRAVHLVLIGRGDPPLPLAGLRMTDRLTEVRAADLRFTAEEVRTVLAAATGSEISSEAASAWSNAAQGWIAGVKLTLAEMEGSMSPNPPIPAACRTVRAYLDQELLRPLPPALRSFLLHVGVLPRFSASLLTEVARESGVLRMFEGESGGALGWLKAQGMFIESLDREHRWFRFHPVVRAYLAERFESENGASAVRDLRAHVDRWLAAHERSSDDPRDGWTDKRATTDHGRASPPDEARTLTRKERETVELLGLGLYYREIAERSFVSTETVKTHLKRAYRKLGVSNRRQAVRRARALGLIEPADGQESAGRANAAG